MSRSEMVAIRYPLIARLSCLSANTILLTDFPRILRLGVVVHLAWLVCAAETRAQVSPHAARTFDGVGLSPKLGAEVPLDNLFTNSLEQPIRLNDILTGEKPAILTFVYHTCPMLCSALLDGVTRTLKEVAWTPGEEYEMVTISIDPEDSPDISRRQQELYVQRLDKEGAVWHFLTGPEESIRAVSQAVGFHYRWVDEIGEYAHPAAVTVLTRDGTVCAVFSRD